MLPSNLLKLLMRERLRMRQRGGHRVGWVARRILRELKRDLRRRIEYYSAFPRWTAEARSRKINGAIGEFKVKRNNIAMLYRMLVACFGRQFADYVLGEMWRYGFSSKIVFAKNYMFYKCIHFTGYVRIEVCEYLLPLKERFNLIFTCPPSVYNKLRFPDKDELFISTRIREMKRWIKQIVWEELQIGYGNYKDVQMEISGKYGLDLTISFIRYCNGLMFSRIPPPKPPEPVDIYSKLKPFDPGILLWKNYLKK